MKTLEKRGVEVKVHQSVYDSIPFAEPFDADKATGVTNVENPSGIATTKEDVGIPPLAVPNSGDVMRSAIHTASGTANNITSTALDVLDSTLATPSPTPSIGGGVQPKDLEDKERKKKRRNR